MKNISRRFGVSVHASGHGEPVRASRRRQPETRTLVGVKMVEWLLTNTMDGGLGWVFDHCCTDKAVLPPVDRLSMLYFTCAYSPVLSRCLELCMENRNRGKRTLVLCESPWVQQ